MSLKNSFFDDGNIKLGKSEKMLTVAKAEFRGLTDMQPDFSVESTGEIRIISFRYIKHPFMLAHHVIGTKNLLIIKGVEVQSNMEFNLSINKYRNRKNRKTWKIVTAKTRRRIKS
ncbi:hypothetical protein DRO26_01215 [Candidatus Bathyarchaeota archaeon]|nr:MAG: hypothetical protein DRO26_01215 [Candidatus Bathyarchaeota archaeon]